MARANSLYYGVLFLAVYVSALSESEINYGVLNTLLQSPVRDEARKSEFSVPDIGVVSEEPGRTNDTSPIEPIVVAPFIGASPSLTPSLDDVTFEDDVTFRTDPPSNPIDEGVTKMTEIYRECNRKIDKRVENLLSWKFSKSNTEKDLIELKEYALLLYRCLKVQSFRYFDSVINEEVIPVTQFVEFVQDSRSPRGITPLMGPSHLGDGIQSRISPQYVSEIVQNDWSALLLDRLSKLLETHSMKFRLEENGVGRRRDHKMFAMMVMGFMVMASILIPMGFQFLTVLGGKSLLMAKMALIMSAINGLKKIATSHVGYGFYHTAPEAHHDHGHHHGFHEKLFKVKREPEFL